MQHAHAHAHVIHCVMCTHVCHVVYVLTLRGGGASVYLVYDLYTVHVEVSTRSLNHRCQVDRQSGRLLSSSLVDSPCSRRRSKCPRITSFGFGFAVRVRIRVWVRVRVRVRVWVRGRVYHRLGRLVSIGIGLGFGFGVRVRVRVEVASHHLLLMPPHHTPVG